MSSSKRPFRKTSSAIYFRYQFSGHARGTGWSGDGWKAGSHPTVRKPYPVTHTDTELVEQRQCPLSVAMYPFCGYRYLAQ